MAHVDRLGSNAAKTGNGRVVSQLLWTGSAS